MYISLRFGKIACLPCNCPKWKVPTCGAHPILHAIRTRGQIQIHIRGRKGLPVLILLITHFLLTTLANKHARMRHRTLTAVHRPSTGLWIGMSSPTLIKMIVWLLSFAQALYRTSRVLCIFYAYIRVSTNSPFFEALDKSWKLQKCHFSSKIKWWI